MKILLIGPYPPPHGGVSVHVYEACRQLRQAGVQCRVLNVDPRAPRSSEYIRIRSGAALAWNLLRHAISGWTLHVHTNGHNLKSWLIALAGGIAGRFAPAALLTLHSGMAPEYIQRSPAWERALVRVACGGYGRIVAVSPAIRDALVSLGIPLERLEIQPAFLFTSAREADIPADARQWIAERKPLLAAALFFRPEYGFSLLVDAVERLRARHPRLCCLVMGSGERKDEAEVLIQERGLQGTVVLLGNVTHPGCLALMAAADLFVRPTLADGDAISVREALSLGTPVVASNVGTRPHGAVLFRAGDVQDLVARVDEVLARPTPEFNRGAAGAGVERLLEIYSCPS